MSFAAYKTYLNDASEANKHALNNAIQAWYKGASMILEAVNLNGLKSCNNISLKVGQIKILSTNRPHSCKS